MSRQITHYDDYRTCTDGNLLPAQILVTNHLIRGHRETAIAILKKHGMKEFADYRTPVDDDCNAIILAVRPDAYDNIRETLVELSAVSKEVQARDYAEDEKLEKIRNDAVDEFERVFAEIDKLIGEDV